VVLRQGRALTAGTPQGVLTEKLIADVYGVRVAVTAPSRTAAPTYASSAPAPAPRITNGARAPRIQEENRLLMPGSSSSRAG
jgi:iron complex transport system ATP-binding protein